jgi:hypothetical protein
MSRDNSEINVMRTLFKIKHVNSRRKILNYSTGDYEYDTFIHRINLDRIHEFIKKHRLRCVSKWNMESNMDWFENLNESRQDIEQIIDKYLG